MASMKEPDNLDYNDILPFRKLNALGFYPGFDTCYLPNLARLGKCNECGYREHVLCKESDNYKNLLEEISKKD